MLRKVLLLGVIAMSVVILLPIIWEVVGLVVRAALIIVLVVIGIKFARWLMRRLSE